MNDRIRITGAKMQSANATDVESGLLGWVALELNDTLQLDGLTLRRTRDGRLTLSYPARRDVAGRKHSYVRPLDDRARRDIERQVLTTLGLDATR